MKWASFGSIFWVLSHETDGIMSLAFFSNIWYGYHLKAFFKYFHMVMMASRPIAFFGKRQYGYHLKVIFEYFDTVNVTGWLMMVFVNGIFCRDFTMKGCGRWGSDEYNVTCSHPTRGSLIAFLGCEMSKCKFCPLYLMFNVFLAFNYTFTLFGTMCPISPCSTEFPAVYEHFCRFLKFLTLVF